MALFNVKEKVFNSFMNILIALVIYILPLWCEDGSERIVLDEVVAYVTGESGVRFVCRSDEWLPNPMGMIVPFEQTLIKQVWLSHADAHNIKVGADGSNEYAERYLDNLQEQRGVTRDTLRHMCSEMGYTLIDLKNELGAQYLMQQAIEVALTARGALHVSPREIQEFYEQHPLVIPITYTLQRGEIKNEKEEWDEPYTAHKRDLGEVFSTIEEIPDGSLIEIPSEKKEDSRVVYRVVSRAPEYVVPLYERYDEIMHILQEEQYQKAYKSVTLEFLKDSSIEFCHDEDREKIEQFINGSD